MIFDSTDHDSKTSGNHLKASSSSNKSPNKQPRKKPTKPPIQKIKLTGAFKDDNDFMDMDQ